ncbi:hypothetical protein MY4824_006352 [Beauveria thailandica]
MLAQGIFLPLLLAIGAQGRALHDTAMRAPAEMYNEAQVHARDEGLAITPEILGEAAAQSREGKVRMARVKSLMTHVTTKWPSSGIYFNKKHKDYDCFLSHHPQRQLDQDKTVNIRILASPLKSLSSGQSYTTEEIKTKMTTSFKAETSGSSSSKTVQTTWEVSPEFSLGPLGKWLTFGLAGKWSKEKSNTQGSSTSDGTENSDSYSVAVKKGRKVTCPPNHTCDLQSWTYQATFRGSSPVIPMVDFTCVWDHTKGYRDVIGALPWQVPGNILPDMDNYCTHHEHPPNEAEEDIWKMESGVLGRKSDFELTLINQGIPLLGVNCRSYRGDDGYFYNSHFVGKIAMELIDRKMGSWASNDEGPKYYKLKDPSVPEQGKAVSMSKWLYENGAFQYDPQAQDAVEYLQHEDWSWEFPVRNPDSSIMTSTVLVKTPYGASNKRGEDGEVTIEIIDENMDMVMEHYDFMDFAANLEAQNATDSL